MFSLRCVIAKPPERLQPGSPKSCVLRAGRVLGTCCPACLGLGLEAPTVKRAVCCPPPTFASYGLLRPACSQSVTVCDLSGFLSSFFGRKHISQVILLAVLCEGNQTPHK